MSPALDGWKLGEAVGGVGERVGAGGVVGGLVGAVIKLVGTKFGPLVGAASVQTVASVHPTFKAANGQLNEPLEGQAFEHLIAPQGSASLAQSRVQMSAALMHTLMRSQPMVVHAASDKQVVLNSGVAWQTVIGKGKPGRVISSVTQPLVVAHSAAGMLWQPAVQKVLQVQGCPSWVAVEQAGSSG